MRIKEYSIIRYGPLSNSRPTLLENFTLLFGNNEEGKSLTIDAIVKMLFKRKRDLNEFEEMDRVEETPEGYLIIENKNGGEIKLPEAGDISKIANLSPSDCSNLFIIRNSNLSISHDIESDYYRNITDRLTGLRTEEISRIKKKLQDFGKLVNPDSKSAISNSEKYEKIAGRIKNAQKLIEDIEKLQKDIKEKGYEKIDEELASLNENLEEINQKLDEMEQAEKRIKYEKTSKALYDLKNVLQTIKDLALFNRENEQKWRDADRDVKLNREKKKELINEIEVKEKELGEKKEEEKKLKREFLFLQRKKEKIEGEVKIDIKSHEKLIKSNKWFETLWQNAKMPAYIMAALIPILVLGKIITAETIYTILTLIFGIVLFVLFIIKIISAGKKSKVATDFEKIKLKVSGYEFNTESLEDINKSIQEFEKNYEIKEKEINDISQEISLLEKEIKKIEEKEIPELESKISDSEKIIDEIKFEVSVDSIEDYKNKIKVKQKAEKKMDEQAAVLRTYFGGKGTIEENVPDWEKEIEKLKKYRDKSKDIEFDEEALNELKSEKEKIENKKYKLQISRDSYKSQLIDIENKANKLHIEEEKLLCSTYVDLESVKDKLNHFISENEENARKVREVIKIFEEIEQEEEKKVQELFGIESPVSSYFEEITGGRYKAVEFIPDEAKIVITQKNGKKLEAKKLSGGAYDQLYFSIRLALGDKLMKGEKGFFIMDDPFIKADRGRLKQQLNVLKRISELGWQIVYFSAKDEIKESLKSEIDKGNVKLVEIKGIRS